jgi:hypothetical protein
VATWRDSWKSSESGESGGVGGGGFRSGAGMDNNEDGLGVWAGSGMYGAI